MADLRLTVPSLHRLPAYLAALEGGWSASTVRDISGEQRAAATADPDAFIAGLRDQGPGRLTLPDGTEVERLPWRIFWIWDDTFCGVINLRFRPGTLDLPPHVSGHIGYAVVPWKRRQGIATRALGLILPVAWALGLPRVLLTCDEGNEPSRRVILANGGVPAGTTPDPDTGGTKNLFWIDTAA